MEHTNTQLDTQIAQVVASLKASKGAEWLLEHLQGIHDVGRQEREEMAAFAAQNLPDMADAKHSSVSQPLTPQESEERRAMLGMSQQAMQRAYAADEYEYTLDDAEWINPNYVEQH